MTKEPEITHVTIQRVALSQVWKHRERVNLNIFLLGAYGAIKARVIFDICTRRRCHRVQIR